jgi:hypothetical protein
MIDTMKTPKPTTPAITDFLSLLGEAISILFSEPKALTLNDNIHFWLLYRVEKRSGEVAVEWLTSEELVVIRPHLNAAGFILDNSWHTAPPTTRFVKATL